MTLRIWSTAFEAGSKIPFRYSREGEEISPPLYWDGAPLGAEEFALICDDPDAPTEQPWVHWVLYKVPGNLSELAEGSNGGGSEGRTDFDEQRYGGPMPPEGHGVHHYHFKLFALDEELDLKPGLNKLELLDAVQGHVLEEAELIGTYER